MKKILAIISMALLVGIFAPKLMAYGYGETDKILTLMNDTDSVIKEFYVEFWDRDPNNHDPDNVVDTVRSWYKEGPQQRPKVKLVYRLYVNDNKIVTVCIGQDELYDNIFGNHRCRVRCSLPDSEHGTTRKSFFIYPRDFAECWGTSPYSSLNCRS